MWETITPKIGGVTLDDGSKVAGRQKIDGGPSVLYDAVAVLPSAAGAALLAKDAAAKDFVSDAFGHCKYIGVGKAAKPLFDAARIDDLDDGCVLLAKAGDGHGFIATCGKLRYWPREMTVDLDAAAVR